MTHKLIKTDNYLLVVDNSDPNKGDYTYNIDNGLISISDKILSLSEMLSRKTKKKVIAHLPLNGSPILEGVDLLPPLEDDVYKDLFFYKLVMNPYPSGEYAHTAYEEGFKDGYKKAVEKYKYTEEDMIEFAIWRSITVFDSPYTALGEFRLWESSRQEYPTEFESIMEYNIYTQTDIPQTITTAQGIQWVGKYK